MCPLFHMMHEDAGFYSENHERCVSLHYLFNWYSFKKKDLCKILCTFTLNVRDPQWNHVDANFQSFPAFVLPFYCFGDAVSGRMKFIYN